MKLLNYRMGCEIRVGIQTDQGIVDVQNLVNGRKDIPSTMEGMISHEHCQSILCILNDLLSGSHHTIPGEGIEYAPCVTKPEKILCVGTNYYEHAKECDMAPPEFPVLFSKFNSTLAAHNQTIVLPETARQFDYEAELVVIIGKTGSHIPKAEALSYVFGYTAGNDLSARDLQLRTSQWLLGKTLDDFSPIGPHIVTADELDGSLPLEIRCEVNGELCQLANTSSMIFDCATLISYISMFVTLKPGDIIFTGTPQGVILGKPQDQQHWLKSGDKIVVSIENIGQLSNILI